MDLTVPKITVGAPLDTKNALFPDWKHQKVKREPFGEMIDNSRMVAKDRKNSEGRRQFGLV